LTCVLRSRIQIIGIDQFYFLTFELDIGLVNCTGPVSATLFIYLRYLGDNPDSSLFLRIENKSNRYGRVAHPLQVYLYVFSYNLYYLYIMNSRAKSPPSAVAQAWLLELSGDQLHQAADKMVIRTQLRVALMNSGCPEYKQDAKTGFKYTASVLRAADSVLGIALQRSFGAVISDSTRSHPGDLVIRNVVVGDGRPGSLGIYWSDFKNAAKTSELKSLGITHRLNVAIEKIDKFHIVERTELVTNHVPMEDWYNDTLTEAAIPTWTNQLQETLNVLLGWREIGAIVNISCAMVVSLLGSSFPILILHRVKTEAARQYLYGSAQSVGGL
jgi:hypothetical protein